MRGWSGVCRRAGAVRCSHWAVTVAVRGGGSPPPSGCSQHRHNGRLLSYQLHLAQHHHWQPPPLPPPPPPAHLHISGDADTYRGSSDTEKSKWPIHSNKCSQEAGDAQHLQLLSSRKHVQEHARRGSFPTATSAASLDCVICPQRPPAGGCNTRKQPTLLCFRKLCPFVLVVGCFLDLRGGVWGNLHL